jgi:uncharacterized protein YjbI with pentapeptide repeats
MSFNNKKFEPGFKQKKNQREALTNVRAQHISAQQNFSRLTFLTLIGILLYLSTVAYNTTHLDLLLNTKVGVIWSLVELPRRWVMGIGAFVLVIVLYEAISLHHRLDRQFQVWLKTMPQTEIERNKQLTWIQGGLVSDTYGSAVFGRLLATLAYLVLYGVLWLAPLATLTLMQAVVMPVHSEWLTGSIRVSMILACLLVGYSAFQLHLKSNANTFTKVGLEGTSKSINILQKTFAIFARWLAPGSLIFVSLFLTNHVFLWPGELLQRLQADIATTTSVWNPEVDKTTTYREFLGLTCGIKNDSEQYKWIDTTVDTGVYGYNNFSYDRKPFDTSKPQSERADFGSNVSFFNPPSPSWRCPDRDDKTVVSTQLLRAWLSQFSNRFSPNYALSNEIIAGSSLAFDEREILSKHTDKEPLDPKFYTILKKITPLDLRFENLRYATFCNAWLPKVLFPSAEQVEGANFCGAKMQGAKLFFWKEPLNTIHNFYFPNVEGIDVSGGSIFGAVFEDTTIGFTAIASSIQGLRLNGVNLQKADLRFAKIELPEFLQSRFPGPAKNNRITNSNFSGAVIESPQFHATIIENSKFIGAQISNPLFFKGTLVLSSDFSLANLHDSQSAYSGTNLVTWKSSKMNLTQMPFNHKSKHVFDATMKDTKPIRTLIFDTVSAEETLNPIGPMWITNKKLSPVDLKNLSASFPNFWLIQRHSEVTKLRPRRWSIDYESVLQRCETDGSYCFSFSPTLQRVANGTMSSLCEEYSMYISSEMADTLYSAATIAQPNKWSGSTDLYNEVQRKKFNSCLKNMHGLPLITLN